MLCFLLAWAAFEKHTREDTWAAPTAGRPVGRVRRFRALAAGRVWRNPLAWKEFHFVSGGKGGLVGRCLAIVLFSGVWVCLESGRQGGVAAEEAGRAFARFAGMFILMELTIMADRLFGHECKWHTITTVTRLPVTARRLVWSKVAGGLIAVLPYVAWMCLGASLMNLDVYVAVSDLLHSPSVWIGLGFYVLFLHLVVYFSLTVKRGAMLVAVLVAAGAGLCILAVAAVPLLFVLHPAVFLVCAGVELAVVLSVIQRYIVERLQRTAELE